MAYQISFPPLVTWRAPGLTGSAPSVMGPICGEARREEIANCLTHGFGLLLSIIGGPFLIALALSYGNVWHVAGCSVYGATLVMAYAASTLYHGSQSPGRKRFLGQMDQAFVYLLIAGTYTPFMLVPLHGGWGWSLLTIVWGVALAATGVKLLFNQRCSGATIPLCLCLGWLCVIAIVPLAENLPGAGVLWLLAGGVAYTLGTVFLVRKPVPFSHALWHIAVLLGSLCHYLAVMLYVIPWG